MPYEHSDDTLLCVVVINVNQILAPTPPKVNVWIETITGLLETKQEEEVDCIHRHLYCHIHYRRFTSINIIGI